MIDYHKRTAYQVKNNFKRKLNQIKLKEKQQKPKVVH